MDATIVFRGGARASMNPTFVDQCTGILNPAHWGEVGPVTAHLFPCYPSEGTPFASFAWRNEVFAYAFPVSAANIALGRTSDKTDAVQYPCEGGCRPAIEALADLLAKYILEKVAIQDRWRTKALKERSKITAAFGV